MAAHGPLEPLEAILLGVVEGLTEFLPVSSTGHLLLAQRALGLERTPALDAFVVVVQVGAILAVLGLYRARTAQLCRGLVGRDAVGTSLLVRLALAFLPAVVLGLVSERAIERHLFGLWPITVAWAVGGVLLILLARRPTRADARPLEALTLQGALLVGTFQCAALLPGTSRSLVTLLGGLVAGLTLGAAVEFSFLLGVVTLAAAAAWKLVTQGGPLLAEVGGQALALGSVAAAVSAAGAVAFLAAWVRRHGLAPFGWYRLALAGVVAALLLAGRLPA
jgi:undecaprenyl-diphosphatase